MAQISTERSAHAHTGELVVFLIGMRINKPWRPNLWLPVFTKMPKMLAELSADPESGLLGYRLVFGLRGPWLVQYWDSHQKLYDYASRPDAAHRPAWTRFNRRIRRAPGSVGSGTRPSSSTGPSPATSGCRPRGWPRRPRRSPSVGGVTRRPNGCRAGPPRPPSRLSCPGERSFGWVVRRSGRRIRDLALVGRDHLDVLALQ